MPVPNYRRFLLEQGIPPGALPDDETPGLVKEDFTRPPVTLEMTPEPRSSPFAWRGPISTPVPGAAPTYAWNPRGATMTEQPGGGTSIEAPEGRADFTRALPADTARWLEGQMQKKAAQEAAFNRQV